MTRDRDDAGRPRSARPRDRLGRPLARRPGRQLPPVDPPALTAAETLARAQTLLAAGRPFEAHEVLEARWKAPDEPDPQLWRGLAQLAVGVTHRERGNLTGATALLTRAAATLTAYAGSTPYGVAVDALRAWAADPGAASAQPPAMPSLIEDGPG